jgi:hypothetical protein
MLSLLIPNSYQGKVEQECQIDLLQRRYGLDILQPDAPYGARLRGLAESGRRTSPFRPCPDWPHPTRTGTSRVSSTINNNINIRSNSNSNNIIIINIININIIIIISNKGGGGV